jgi:hypothetical protein
MKTPHARGNELNERDIELFNDSLERCTSGRQFLDRFYELFAGSSAEVAAKFANTDFRVQKAAVKVSFYMIMSSIGIYRVPSLATRRSVPRSQERAREGHHSAAR